jgi:hypothetical protein
MWPSVCKADVLGLPASRAGCWRARCRRIKRVTKRAGGGDSDGDSGSDDDLDDLDDEGDDDSEDEGPEVCPPGCDLVGGTRAGRTKPRWLEWRNG